MAYNKENKIDEAFNPNKSSVKSLKLFLRDHGEFISGNKSELIERAKGVVELGRKPLQELTLKDVNNAKQRNLKRFTTPFGENLPHPGSLASEWVNDINKIPHINEKDMYNYLVLNTERTFDNERMQANRALKAKVFFKDGHIHGIQYHAISESCTHCYVKSKVMPSIPQQENKKPDYDVWLCMSKVSGHIHSAGCNCSAGEGESCSHIAGLLYGLIDLTEKKIEGLHSSTSTECWWMKPRKRKLSPKKSQDLVFKKHKFCGESKDVKRKIIETQHIKPVDISTIAHKLSKSNRSAAWLHLRKETLASVHIPNKKSLPVLHDVKFMYRDTVDLTSSVCVDNFGDIFKDLTLSKDEANTILELTAGQANNPDWFNARKGRLTASQFGNIIKRKETTPPENLLKSIFQYEKQYNGPSIQWGKSHERAARRHYISLQKKKHLNLKCDDSGFFVSTLYPHLGASPDGLVSCDCCGEGLLEIKCPFTWRFKHPLEACSDKNFFCSSEKERLILKQNHSYFFQIQGQMAISGRKYCDFFVWTLKGYTSQRISFEATFWTDCVNKLNSFYLRAVLPELYTERVKRGKTLY